MVIVLLLGLMEKRNVDKRITIEELDEALMWTNIPLTLGTFYNPCKHCACPQTILYVCENCELPLKHRPNTMADADVLADKVVKWTKEVYGDQYSDGFRHGYDNPKRYSGVHGGEFNIGFQDGVKVREHFLNKIYQEF